MTRPRTDPPSRADPRRRDVSRRRAAVGAAAVLALLFWAAAVPLILGRCQRGPTADDQRTYHLPTIRAFAARWPRPDLRDYPSATTPAYHLLLAGAARASGAKGDVSVGLQLFGSVFAAGLLATLGAAVALCTRGGWGGLRVTVALCAPVLCSTYVFTAGVWLVPHDLGWWLVLAVLLVALRRRVDGWTYVGGSALMLALVLARQIHVWAAAPLVVGAWLGSSAPPGRDNGPPRTPAPDETSLWANARRAAGMAGALAPAALALCWFFRLWHGTTPPNQQPLVTGGNAATPAVVLALVGVYGVFYTGFLPACFARGGRRTLPAGAVGVGAPPRQRLVTWLLAGAASGLLVGAVPRSTYDRNAGRWGGLWNLVARAPTWGGRSPLIIGFATLGGAVLAAWLLALPRRDRHIFLTAYIAFIVAQCSASQAWQRYEEPFVLMSLALMAARVRGPGDGRSEKEQEDTAQPREPLSPRAAAGPLALALLLAIVTAAGLL